MPTPPGGPLIFKLGAVLGAGQVPNLAQLLRVVGTSQGLTGVKPHDASVGWVSGFSAGGGGGEQAGRGWGELGRW